MIILATPLHFSILLFLKRCVLSCPQDQDKDIAVLQVGPIGPAAEEAPGDGSSKPQQLVNGAAPSTPSGSSSSGSGSGSGNGTGAAGAAAAVLAPPVPALDVPPLSLCSSSADIVVGQKVREGGLGQVNHWT